MSARPTPWTPERLALLRELAPTMMHLDVILHHINALPGPMPVSSADAVRAKAGKLRIARQNLPIPERFDGAQTSRPRRVKAADADDADDAPARAVPLTTEDRHEIRERLRKGRYRDARAIVADYGCTHVEAAAVMEQHQARRVAA